MSCSFKVSEVQLEGAEVIWLPSIWGIFIIMVCFKPILGTKWGNTSQTSWMTKTFYLCLLTMSPKSDGFLSLWQIRKLTVIYYNISNWHTTPSLIICSILPHYLVLTVTSAAFSLWRLTCFIRPKRTAQSLRPYGPGQKFEYRPGYSQSIKFSLISHKWFVRTLNVTV